MQHRQYAYNGVEAWVNVILPICSDKLLVTVSGSSDLHNLHNIRCDNNRSRVNL